ncbi:Rz1-like lysis system protein LysC [Pseudomonas sp. AO-1]|uniref:Rz1-like lysis system protein LysC n=1 Tax=Pseudomonas sp. AO-1 TaxID=2855434 RepID=UPI001C786165|nr:Rz1-like lysis system protein LysC [Pseudomonas sp. AO-1]QXZ14038.1 Rz1-like lysis system protein LysC [Pseudomonas sp. AO-1]
MKMPNFAFGLTSICLTLLAGCASVPPSPEPQLIATGCPAVVPCTLSATKPDKNGTLLNDQEVIENDWAQCAAQVDMVYQHQQAKARKP